MTRKPHIKIKIYITDPLQSLQNACQATTISPIYDERRVNNACIGTEYDLRKTSIDNQIN